MNNTNTPYSNLDPNLILTAIESLGLRCNGSLLALNSFENRVYQVGIEDDLPLVAKFYRPNRWTDEAIREEHQFALELAGQEIPVIAPIVYGPEQQSLHEYQGYRFALFPRKGGRVLELDDLDQLEWMGRFIGRLHAVSACRPFKHRMRLDVASYGEGPYRFLIDNNFVPADILEPYRQTVEALLAEITLNFQQVGELNYLRLHGDCHAGNVLWNDEGPQIVDLDDCLMGPAVQDLWMLISGSQEEEREIKLHRILRGYEEFNEFNDRELYLVESLRSLRLIHYSAWLARRWEDPTFPLHFPWFNTRLYWMQQVDDLGDQLGLLRKVNESMRWVGEE